METRDVLDKDGNIIGSLTLPDDTGEGEWSGKLTDFTYSVPVATITQTVTKSIANAIQFGNKTLLEEATNNVLLGITQAGKTGAVMDYVHEMVHALITGSLYEAIIVLNGYIADAGSTKASLSPFITNDRLTSVKNKIQTYLGIPLT